jgi:hypothetical protein
MFNLEQSIAEWRQQMLAAGIKSPAPLEELESHLREEIERLRELGIDEGRAFGKAVQQIGPPNALKREFQKLNMLTIERKRIIAIAAGVLTVFTGFILVWGAAVQSREAEKMAGSRALFVLGLSLFIDGAAISFLASKRSFLATKRKYVTASS